MEEFITELLEVNLTVACLMEVDASREPFDFEMAVSSSARTPTTVSTWDLTNLQ